MMSEPKRNLVAAMRSGRSQAQKLKDRLPPRVLGQEVRGDVLQQEYEHALTLMDGSLAARERARMLLSGIVASNHPALGEEARNALERLRVLEDQHFGPKRAQIRSGDFDRTELMQELAKHPVVEQDLYLNRLLGIQSPPIQEQTSDPNQTHYLPSPWSVIEPVLSIIGPDDVFFDLGSGLAKVPFLVRWLTGARSIGVEYDAALGRAAEAARAELGLDVELITADAREVSYESGTFFYFYEPFRGPVLNAVFERIRKAAEDHPVRLAVRWVTSVLFAPPDWVEELEPLGSLRLFRSLPPEKLSLSPSADRSDVS